MMSIDEPRKSLSPKPPLSGVKVLDFSTLLPGPLASLMLAEAGATVVKIERPGGEDMRHFKPDWAGVSAPYAVLNAGKTAYALDLKSKDVLSQLRPLIETADILLEQFRPGVMERLGLGYEALRAINPRLIYCSITGYGQDGPRAQEAGHDLNYIARSGLLSLSPGPLERPTLPPALVADIAGGTYPAVLNVLLALRQRDQTGEGCKIDIAMAEGAKTFAWYGLAEGHATGRFPGREENALAGALPRYAVYGTADGRYLAVGALEEKFWRTFCDAIGLDLALHDDARDPEATRAAVAALIKAESAETWRTRLEPLDCCCNVVATLEEALRDPHFAARDSQTPRVTTPEGATMPIASLPIAPHLRRGSDQTRAVPNLSGDLPRWPDDD